MKNTRGLWASIVFVVVLVVASIGGFVSGSLKPTLGLDLEGGLSVILKAPDGTGTDVMQQALENIRHRVDAFGVGEPQILVSGTNIEVQLPGLATGTIQPKAKNQTCLAGADGTNYGCSTDRETVQKALGEIKVTPEPSKVCALGADGTQLKCFGDQASADAFVSGITVQPKASATPTPSASATATPSQEGPTGGGQQCLTDPAGATYGCFKTADEATKAQKAVTTKVTANTYCLLAPSTT
ncbi:MAG: hypothetical protein M3O94_04495, partial [Actinomycetota bacterium]|nr:hypothetical protein [Actinomycetota bacterium]